MFAGHGGRASGKRLGLAARGYHQLPVPSSGPPGSYQYCLSLLFSNLRRRPQVRRFQLVVERSAERLTGARQSRHHGTHWYPDDVGQVSVGQTIELAEYEQLMKMIRQTAQGPRNRRGVIGLKQ